MGKLGSILTIAVSAIWVVGCAGTGEPRFAPIGDEVAAVAVPAEKGTNTVEPIVDVISVGQAITVSLSDLPMIVQPIEQRVKEDGTITLLLNQTFVAAGKTRRELETEIRDRYVPKYYQNMTVSVQSQENTRFFYVGGEVRAPGRQVYLGPMTVVKAIQSCGDFTDFAKRTKVQLTRSNGKVFIVDVKKAIKDPKFDMPVYPGDTVNVPRTVW